MRHTRRPAAGARACDEDDLPSVRRDLRREQSARVEVAGAIANRTTASGDDGAVPGQNHRPAARPIAAHRAAIRECRQTSRADRCGSSRFPRPADVVRDPSELVGKVAHRLPARSAALPGTFRPPAAGPAGRAAPRLESDGDLAFEDRGDDLRRTVACERAAARQHFVEHDAEGEHVRAAVRGPAEDLFRAPCTGHVPITTPGIDKPVRSVAVMAPAAGGGAAASRARSPGAWPRLG